MRFYPSAAAAQNRSTPIFLSSGAEDYFLSASYFDEGEFVTPNSGLTFKDGTGGIGSYKMHDLRDQVVWHDGFELHFRVGETTSGCGSEQRCPNQFCPPHQRRPSVREQEQAAVTLLLAQRAAELANTNVHNTSTACTAGPIARGFDRPGADGPIGIMKQKGGQKCTGVAMLNTTGCAAEDCAAMCCANGSCRSWVHGIAPGCDSVGHDPAAVCCWLKTGNPQIVVKLEDHLSTGEVAGHGGAPPTPGPAPSRPPPAPQPPAGKTRYSTLVFTYEWPTADTPSKHDVHRTSLADRLE